MSIEEILKNLTNAINANTEAIKSWCPEMQSHPFDPTGEALPSAPSAPSAPAAPAAPSAPAAPAAPSAPVTMTAEQLNEMLVAEFNRLGDRVPIDAALKEFGVNGVAELPAEKYQELIDKVKAL